MQTPHEEIAEHMFAVIVRGALDETPISRLNQITNPKGAAHVDDAQFI
jgi:hypothetical protein